MNFPGSELKIFPIKHDKLLSYNRPFTREFPVDKIKDGSIIKLFDRTPEPKNPTDVVCPHFYELKWANGCNFNCAWCYLNGTYRFLSRGKKPHLKDIDIYQWACFSPDGFLPTVVFRYPPCGSDIGHIILLLSPGDIFLEPLPHCSQVCIEDEGL